MDLGIVLGVAGLFLAVVFWLVPKESVTRIFKTYSVVHYVNKKNLRSEFRIAIVDDELDSYPVQYIKDLGFTTKEYESVSFADSDALVKNDLVLLDVKGVVREDLDEGGAKLIKIIKESRPLLPVVAVSSGYFHTELNDYFRSSDATLNKPIDEFKIRELLNDLKKEFFDESHIAANIENCIKKLDLGSSKKNKLNKVVVDYLSNKINLVDFTNIVHQNARGSAQEIIDNSKILLDRITNA
ncbi:hypothetical protein L2D36_04995 [Vibrio harveyi]|jgi:hypothetical protein|uniref:hypothetical protein n=1 Tax=Vibrio TaxID=662 RepID=UPI0022CD59B5|nr:hypothetical protein [Vibrio sp. NFR]MDA0131041.1 hypothetical protein [Vibrio sp. NFR]